jgi:hypothetical protein
MNKEEIEFKKQCDETLYSIYSKINEEEKIFLSYVINQFNNICEANNKAIEFIDTYSDGINLSAFDTLKLFETIEEILKGNNND